MSINWNAGSSLFWLRLVLISQLFMAAGCIHFYSNVQTVIANRTAANERLEVKLRGVQSDEINKEVVLAIAKGSVKIPKISHSFY
ncbi:MAG: hypothetical protein IPH08_11100 [Rhodocyclaceae bacterium]|nr:hypothetical protein [Rhodocyclaceae bacterium]